MMNRLTFPNWLIVFVITVLVFAAFYPSLKNDFINWDDGVYLLDNLNYRGLGIETIKWAFTGSYEKIGMYIPITWLTWSLDYMVWGMNPAGYHLTNIIIHAISAALLYLLALKLLRLGSKNTAENELAIKTGAIFAALFWALHPLRVESVTWITERKDVLCGLFFILTLLAYVKYAESKHRRWYWYSFGFAACALLSKPIAVSIPLVLFLLDYYPLQRKNFYWEKAPFAVLAGVVSIFTFWAHHQFGDSLSYALTIGDRLLIMSYGLGFYLEKLIMPANLAPLYELTHKLAELREHYIFYYFLAVSVLVAVWFSRRRFPAIFVGSLFFIVTVLPVSGLFQAGPQIAADRFIYIPSMGLVLLIGSVFIYLPRLFRTKGFEPAIFKALAPAVFVLILIFGIFTWNQQKLWQNAETMWGHVVLVSPKSGIAHNNFGNAILKKGEIDQAIEHYQLAIELSPGNKLGYFNLANAYVLKEEFERAIELYRLILQADLRNEPVILNMGVAFYKGGDVDGAMKIYELALEAYPDMKRVQENLDKIANGVEFRREQRVDH